jgi:hypothetical protein
VNSEKKWRFACGLSVNGINLFYGVASWGHVALGMAATYKLRLLPMVIGLFIVYQLLKKSSTEIRTASLVEFLIGVSAGSVLLQTRCQP